MKFTDILLPSPENDYTPSALQKVAMFGMGMLVVLSFAATNVQALLWQSSAWLVGAVLPAVVVDLTNDERLAEARGTLVRNATLDEAARLKAEDMAQKQYFAHDSPEGLTPWYWFEQVAYNYAHAGENLAIHFNDSGAVVDAWMNSPTHRANIVNGVYTEIGVGTAVGEYEGHETVFVVQLFGTPAALIQPRVTPGIVVPLEALEMSEEPLAETLPLETVSPEVLSEPENLVVLSISPEAEQVLGAVPLPIELPASEPELEPEPVLGLPLAVPTEVVTETTETLFTATSSGLLSAETIDSIGGTTNRYAPRWGEFATGPTITLQIVYLFVGLFIATVLLTSITLSIKQARPLQVAYGIALLLLMSGLFTLHGTIAGTVVIAASTAEYGT